MGTIFASGHTLTDPDNARIAHANNWITGGTVTASGTAANFFADGPDNTLTYEKWQPDALPATWEYDFGPSQSFDYCAIGAHTLGTNGNTLEVQRYDSNSWTDLIPATAITSDMPIFVFFSSQTDTRARIRIANGTAPTVGVVKFGTALAMERPFYGGHSPLDYARETIFRSNYSATGESLGRTKQRQYLTTSFDWQHLSRSWLDSNWKSFQKAVENEPFFIAWRPTSFSEVGLCIADQVPVPTAMGIRDLHQVSLSVRARGYD